MLHTKEAPEGKTINEKKLWKFLSFKVYLLLYYSHHASLRIYYLFFSIDSRLAIFNNSYDSVLCVKNETFCAKKRFSMALFQECVMLDVLWALIWEVLLKRCQCFRYMTVPSLDSSRSFPSVILCFYAFVESNFGIWQCISRNFHCLFSSLKTIHAFIRVGRS